MNFVVITDFFKVSNNYALNFLARTKPYQTSYMVKLRKLQGGISSITTLVTHRDSRDFFPFNIYHVTRLANTWLLKNKERTVTTTEHLQVTINLKGAVSLGFCCFGLIRS